VNAPERAHLGDFLGDVKLKRFTFAERLVPGESMCRDLGGDAYGWTEGDASAIARHYALEIMQGTIVAGQLAKSACKPSLHDVPFRL
jgi:hypothetical protein